MKKPKDRKSPTPPVIMPVLAEESIFSPVLERRPKISARADAMIPGKHAQENTIPPIPKIMDAFAILLLLSIALLLSFVIILPSSPCLVNRANGQFFVADHLRVTVQTGLCVSCTNRTKTWRELFFIKAAPALLFISQSITPMVDREPVS